MEGILSFPMEGVSNKVNGAHFLVGDFHAFGGKPRVRFVPDRPSRAMNPLSGSLEPSFRSAMSNGVPERNI